MNDAQRREGEELLALRAKATEGPWKQIIEPWSNWVWHPPQHSESDVVAAGNCPRMANGAFIAAAHRMADWIQAQLEAESKPRVFTDDECRVFARGYVGDAPQAEIDDCIPDIRAALESLNLPQIDEQTRKDAAIGRLVREKMVSGNSVLVERCIVTIKDIEIIDAAMRQESGNG